MNIPPGFNTVTPYFIVDGAAGFIDFLVAGLGGTEILRHLDGDRIANSQVRLGTSTAMETCGGFRSAWSPVRTEQRLAGSRRRQRAGSPRGPA